MKTLVIGDLHGRLEIAEAALETEHNVVFMGDYLDSFDKTSLKCLQTLKVVTNAVKSEPERVQALLGNHEMSYIKHEMRCSGYSEAIARGLWPGWYDTLKHFTFAEGFLLTHAGVSGEMLDDTGTTLGEYLYSYDHLDIGHSRGGDRPTGGLLWCDWHDEFTTIQGVPQIVGHTERRSLNDSGNGILERGNSFNVDCNGRVNQHLLIKDGKAEVIEL